ncbi:carboxypeptidase-like regulatory domain-containing protein [Pedobacter cryophilus]|uniref:TonB C-terminal domain-containing protein n=1 Tax=Pedobacter cryophilus TaxID=2571271 RepID=A0A4V5NXU5_9SPHI|nr:carboxypeptidase-like regulatory domain-containing protein [Pedobacter cryophilus]TKC00791.1 hypothetical protein FA046_03700 [Pedobacter cryophilus]
MNKQNTDIALIRQYFNGELTPAAKHHLEKRALEDPFLQEAMDGFEAFKVKDKDLEELSLRLAKRIENKEKGIVINWGLKQLSIAASVIFGIAVISIYFNQTPENKAIAVTELQKKEGYPKSTKIMGDTLIESDENLIADLVNSPAIVQNDANPSAQAKQYSPADEITIEPMAQMSATSKADTLALDEVSVIGYAVQQKRDLLAANLSAKMKTENNSALAFRIASVAATSKTKLISGKITDVTDGVALPGVQIINQQNGEVTVSNAKGEFEILASEKADLKISYLGFLSETVAVNNKDVSLDISLKPDLSALSEVVVVGYGTAKKSEEIFAGPKDGWRAFRKYLDANAQLNNGETGRVVVEFVILKNGKLSDFNIQKGLSNNANNKALELIKGYTSWHGAADGRAQKIKVAVRFK